MKKQLLSLCIVIGTMTFAQYSDETRFGIKAGGNLSSITDGDSKSKPGFYGGVFVNIPISEAFNIQPEAVYSQQGAKLKDDYDFVGYTITNMKQTLGYINVPVMVQYNATPEFYLEAGPEFGLLINAQASGDINGTSNKASNKDGLKTFNFALDLGLGYRFSPNIGINARYIAGLSNIVKNSGGEISKNTNFQLGLNYYF
ncbi:PorT family protein [Chryseobacterium elymi]|uniref:PorT family protein n=1 Tax=Chryseobacterium elymi TaxID=395936 RepID=A0A3D9DN97_9FLAO|nr:porin family protein [Chryseobacterium elymi]REC79439.1 PorT family protein [Chryseobacterium elymi]